MSGKESFRLWCQKELSNHVRSTVDGELLDYLMTIETEKDLREYLRDLIGGETSQSVLFIKEFVRHWELQTTPRGENKDGGPTRTTPPPNRRDSPGPKTTSPNTRQDQPPLDETVLFSKKSKEEPPPGLGAHPNGPPGVRVHPGSNSTTKVQGAQRSRPKQTTYVPLMSVEGQSRVSTHLPGRHPCQCLAQKHSLINNCMECGRIVCSQEGSGPCLFCGAIVCTAEEEDWLLRDSKKAKKFREQFLKQHNLESIGRPLDHILKSEGSQKLLKAQHHRDKLLEFDQTSASRTRVIDDQSDYFSVEANRWQSKDEKEALRRKDQTLREQKYGSRRNKAVTLDIAGRQVLDEDQVLDLYSEKHAKDALRGKSGRPAGGGDEVVMTHAGALYNTNIPSERPQFVDIQGSRHNVASAENKKAEKSVGVVSCRLQDRSLREMKDEGCCLSMHQPWASLLVAGIKRCEGRSWYSSHRGRLWIAAAAKEASEKDITQVQQFYMALRKQENLFFPSDYPCACLLGCVDIIDCLSQEDYKENYPEEESESDYVLVVENPQELTVKFPIKGHHKIWKLAKDVHAAAKKGLKN